MRQHVASVLLVVSVWAKYCVQFLAWRSRVSESRMDLGGGNPKHEWWGQEEAGWERSHAPIPMPSSSS